MPDHPLGLMNASVITFPEGSISTAPLTLEEAKHLVAESDLDSAVGHESTAQLMSTLLDREIPVNRQRFQQQVGQKALVFQLDQRPPEGKILSAEELKEIGFSFRLLTRTE